MANFTRDELIAEARRIVGKTDATKGGADDTVYAKLVNVAIGDLCRDAKALKSVFFLDTKGGDKYVPLIDEILWIEQAQFMPLGGGMPVPMSLLDGPVLPTVPGIPTSWWWTALNVPDINGPSVRTIGIHPFTATDMDDVIRVDAFQRAKSLTAGTDVPEIHELFHETIAIRVAYYAILPYREKHSLLPELRNEWRRGVEEFKEFCSPGRKMATKVHDTTGRRGLLRNMVR